MSSNNIYLDVMLSYTTLKIFLETFKFLCLLCEYIQNKEKLHYKNKKYTSNMYKDKDHNKQYKGYTQLYFILAV